ncbi:tripartite motif containing 105 isoform X2 [Electrophorus electricus]|uniref:tripartite motif containing 105 isoform X2 n=1 Tax=Electrophorus electricus TaxID=8005 RepID=UPI000F0A64C2|nr:tripartite motif containing 105 isoform X2 [Electrophorus electricus]
MAADNTNKMSLRDDLTCAICYDLFKDPVMLGCMHHFCKQCISTYWRSMRGPVSCPQCRQEFPNKQFQVNYLVAGLVEKVGATSSGYLRNLEKLGAELRNQMRSDFQALHHFLQMEEVALLKQLHRDQEELEQRIKRHLEALHIESRELEKSLPELNSKPPVQAITPQDIDGFTSKYMSPLQYTVWRKMFNILKPGPLPLTFDEDTVHPSLQLSLDRTQVVENDAILPYKFSTKRFVKCVNVFAAQGFQSGRHYWEVGVGTKPKWDLGIALEVVDRHTRVKLCPENGYWTLRLRNGREYSAGTQPWRPLPVTSQPLSIGIFLDCEEQRISFYNADNMHLLYSFSNGPSGKSFPFFSTCLSESGQQPKPIRLLHFPRQSL